MKYKFPLIRTLDDVLPAIEGHKEIIVAERDDFFVVNYMVALPTTFEMDGPDDVLGAIRRECRGIMFDKAGKIISRPVHKFFNLGEKDETRSFELDFTKEHTALVKEDGSMLRPLLINDKIRWATKMGFSEVAVQAEQIFLDGNEKYDEFARYCIANDMTPIFEWVSPENKIVLRYDDHNLVLLAVRNLYNGTYVNLHA